MADAPGGPGKKGLTHNQKRFIEEYAIDRNAVQAYFRAFGRTTSEGRRRTYRTAQVQSSRLLSNPIIAAELAAADTEHAARCRVSARRVMRGVADLAFFDPGDLLGEDPHTHLPVPRRWSQLAPGVRRSLMGVKITRRRVRGDGGTVEEVETVEYKFPDKAASLKLLAQRLRLLDSATAAGGDTAGPMTVVTDRTPTPPPAEPADGG